MPETPPPPAPEQVPSFRGPITAEDTWLIELGVEWPEPDQEAAWLDAFNALAEQGNVRMPDGGDAQIEATRHQFVDLLTGVSESSRAYLKQFEKYGVISANLIFNLRRFHATGFDIVKILAEAPVAATRHIELDLLRDDLQLFKLDLAAAVNEEPRLLLAPRGVLPVAAEHWSKRGVDVSKLIKNALYALCLQPRAIDRILECFSSRDIDGVQVINKIPPSLLGRFFQVGHASLGQHIDDLRACGLDAAKTLAYALSKNHENRLLFMEELRRRGLNPIKCINAFPQLFGYSPETIDSKLANLKSLGFDAVKLINQKPDLLKYDVHSLRVKFLLAKSALRAWGVDDPHAAAVQHFTKYPVAFSNKPDKMRTLIRIASVLLPPQDAEDMSPAAIQPLTTLSLEAVLATYLEYRPQPAPRPKAISLPPITDTRNLRAVARKYDELAKTTLLRIIRRYDPARDRALKFYHRGYGPKEAA